MPSDTAGNQLVAVALAAPVAVAETVSASASVSGTVTAMRVASCVVPVLRVGRQTVVQMDPQTAVQSVVRTGQLSVMVTVGLEVLSMATGQHLVQAERKATAAGVSAAKEFPKVAQRALEFRPVAVRKSAAAVPVLSAEIERD